MKIGILGDTHGTANTVLGALRYFFANDVDTIIQVGDFGFWPGSHGSTFVTYVNTLLKKNNQTMYVVPGNHEDYNQIKNFPEREDGWLIAKENILVAPRGHRWEWNGVSFVALGGAPSPDRTWRVQGQRMKGIPLWWPEEAITPEEAEYTMAGGYADVMIAHDAPHGVGQIERRIEKNPNGFYKDDLEYALQGRMLMLNVVDVVRPKLFFHGHYHFMVDDRLYLFNENTGMDDEVQIKGLSSDGQPNSMGILDLETLKFRFEH